MENMGVGIVEYGSHDRGYHSIDKGRNTGKSNRAVADEMTYGQEFGDVQMKAGQSAGSNVVGVAQADGSSELIRELGIGFLFVGNLGMGMSAGQVTSDKSDEVIVRVQVSKGGNESESFDINLSEVDPRNASAIEMFALCQYADATGTGVDDKWGSWHALKQFSVPFGEVLEYATLEEAAYQKQDWTKALSGSNDIIEREGTGETMSAADVFRMLKETMMEQRKLTSDNIKREEDWREMDAEEWDKLIARIDHYIDALKEELEHMEELRKEAAWKAMAEAPAAMRATVASKAMLSVMAGGLVGTETSEDTDCLEKNSWTYDLQTEEQVSLATAKLANEYAPDMLSKAQEIAIIGDTSVGIGKIENLRESVSVTEDEDKKKIWTITTYTEQGIICNQSTEGITKELWHLDYQNPDDAKRVWEFLAEFDKNADLAFAGKKVFWENFLS